MSPFDSRNHCEPGESFVVVRKESSHGSSIIIKSEEYAILDQHHHSGSIGSIECEISSETTDTVVDDNDDSNYDHKSIGIWERKGNQNTSRRKRNDREHSIDDNTTSRMSGPLEKNTGVSENSSDGSPSSIRKNEGYSMDDRESSSVSIECQLSSDTTTGTVIIIDDDDDDTNSTNTSSTRRNLRQQVKRASVGVAGGTLVVLGVILSPLPIPVSFLCIGSGLHVLSTEFEGMKQAEQKLVDTVGRWCCDNDTTV